MWLYILLYIIVTVAYMQTIDHDRYSPKLLAYLLLMLALFVGCSDMLGGYDRYIYCDLFDGTANTIRNGGNPFNGVLFTLYYNEKGWGILNVIIGYVTANRYIFILIVTLLMYTLLFISLMKYTNRSPFAILVFMGLWFFFTFTYLRQVLAATVVWLAIDYAIKRKPIPFFLIVILGYTIHNSALAFAIVYFLPRTKVAWGLALPVIFACFLAGLSGLPEVVFGGVIDAMQIESRAGDVTDMMEGNSFRFAYLLEVVAFLAFISARYDDIDDNDPKQGILVNIAFIFCCVLMFFVRSENGGRIGWIFMIGVIATLSNLATNRRDFTAYNIAAFVMFTLLYLRVLTAWGGLLSPYKSFFTDGHRPGDQIYQVYEYDPKYDDDKFYR